MSNPVLVEVTRGTRVESRHRGAFAVVGGHGDVVAEAGDIDSPVYPRSAVKILQALPLVENGWADRFGFDDADLALACASHGGEPIHTATARAMLKKLGLDEAALECGVHWPSSKGAARALVRAGAEPSQLHNNCSGKHAGFLCVACALDAPRAGYVGPTHPVQTLVAGSLADLYEQELGEPATDGCSIPTYAVPLRALARAFARLGTGEALGPERVRAAARLRTAVAAHPDLVAGTGRLDTAVAAHFGTRIYTKTGAEGVFCATLPERGWGLALKCDDGGTRASEATLVELLRRLMPWSEADEAAMAGRLSPVLRNWNGIEVGRIRPAAALTTVGRAA